ncbi:ribosome recycling factor [Alphaproteobacteria bacterium]|nr:ribosome recycling factor [Alphaproteobacteria bacterium]
MTEKLFKDIQTKMDGAIDALKREFAGLRTGRASVNFLDPIVVDAYGSKMPLNQVGTVGAPEPRLLTVQVWSKDMVKAVEKAIRESELGLNPAVDGTLIRVPMPDLSEERRRELVKLGSKYAEGARVSVRNVRRDGIDSIRKMEKEGDLSEDEKHRLSDDIQKMTDKSVEEIDKTFSAKEKDIMTV